MKDRLIVNVASGKGGTGKTLFCTMLAELLGNESVPALVVDLDVAVRGLTALLYYHKKEALELVGKGEATTSSFLMAGAQPKPEAKLGISRYRSFDVLPSVARIDQNLSFRDILPDSREAAEAALARLLDLIPDDYKVVILDSRAGYDELLDATHRVSSVTINVAEDDQISAVTADNLDSQLREDRRVLTPLFRLVNKSRSEEKAADLQDEIRGITDLGRIPFDGDVMKAFGADTFWEDISRSLYKHAVALIWNRLMKKIKQPYEVAPTRISPLGSTTLERMLSPLTLQGRVLFVYMASISLFGLTYGILGGEVIYQVTRDPARLVSLLAGVGGLLYLVVNMFRLGKR